MHPTFRRLLPVLLLALVSCGGTSSPSTFSATSARLALVYTQELMRTGKVSSDVFRPSAPLGVFVSMFLNTSASATAKVTTATSGIDAQMALMAQNQQSMSEAFAVLEALSNALEVNVSDMLNRSSDRVVALDSYTTSLSAFVDQAKSQLTAVGQQIQQTTADQRAKQQSVSTIQSDLNKAKNGKDYTTLDQKQQDLLAAQKDLTETTTNLSGLKTTQGVLTDLIDIGTKRLSAMSENREILISGLSVVDVPGIDDLGIIMQKNQNKYGQTNVFGSF